MKTTLPEVPHSTSLHIYRDSAGRAFPAVIVAFPAPSRFLALLSETDGVHLIQSAGIGDHKIIAGRARIWNHGMNTRLNQFRPTREQLQEAVTEGCNATMRVRLSPDEWHLVGNLCGRLRITPGQWFLGCAAYNACFEEEKISKMLESIPAAID